MKKKLLLIDDDVELCEEISDILRDEGFDVEMIHDGKAGLERAGKGAYDLILLDLKIPSMNGMDVLRNIRERKLNVKVIILTGKPFSKELNKKLGVIDNDDRFIFENSDGVLNKPYDIEKLLAEVKKLTA
jgi:two-component system response regulator CpxR